MRQSPYFVCLLLSVILGGMAQGQGQTTGAGPAPSYGVAFASFAPLNSDIFIAAADGSHPRPLLPHADLDYNASFSPDGHWIVFTSTRNGSADIYRVHADGTGLARLTDDEAFDDQGALSPDGRSLAFVSSRSGQADIWVLELATGALRNVTSHPGGDFRPSWSPDGQWIGARGGFKDESALHPYNPQSYGDLYVMRADGTDVRQLTDDAFEEGTPNWRPVPRQR